MSATDALVAALVELRKAERDVDITVAAKEVANQVNKVAFLSSFMRIG